MASDATPAEPRHSRIAVIGAGFGGIAAGLRLRRAGHEDFVIFDRGTDVGGTWRDNTYPGCACDVPSHMYSLSFMPNPGWTRSFSGQAEIWEYLRRCARDLRPRLRLGHEVRGAVWQAGRWLIETSRGAYTADFLVAASGPLSAPVVPDLPGLSSFAGPAFHSAQWDHDLDLRGRSVAVIGTGASAVQFVPRIAPTVSSLSLFQRTAPWVVPRRDRSFSARELRAFTQVPVLRRLARAGVYWGRELAALGFLHPPMMRLAERTARRHLTTSIADPDLRRALTPAYRMGCKRVLLSDDFYPALTRPNVALVTSPIASVTPTGLVTSDGREHRADTIIFGTGFQVTDPPLAAVIRGADGRTLAETWDGSMRAYLGSGVSGFPNLFLLLGPNTGLGHTSVVFMIECQLDHLLRLLSHIDAAGGGAWEPTPTAQAGYVDSVDRRMAGTVWQSGGCHSWYQDRNGRVSALWPGHTWSYWLRTRRFTPAAYRRSPSHDRPTPTEVIA
ncbi:Baeyer-Villiger monooxygenase [Asanoa ishikariensis]|uniref:Predicted flavoprotein CzcO associated with the cation diffusion facilitator CzcD n=1 Tax=Asanoa ishikariensis TaxID=137265 RepID=A0A1H3TVP7_9ACTN|nr:NAD(P)/FAD-dependent oxidoreductase [Asanoa ishikariensis]GIF67558.1 Baeyer-Villiger monooxygenase [Asanoa ishikariensis]SDZ54128.1 Predicted flavoprotein CzcO associated with the cation diffusion facilitator CzcD [Asanoa ishikariensis]